jgi:hypothetical protein
VPSTTNLQLSTGYNFLVGGSVGIGTTNHATYKVDVNGTLNATNLLINGNTVSGSKWTTTTDVTRIYYNTGNVGIGTTNPLTKLHVRDDTTNTTSLTIQNIFTSGGAITAAPSMTTTGTSGNYTYMIFTYTTETGGAGSGQSLYTLNVSTSGVVCDILMIGGSDDVVHVYWCSEFTAQLHVQGTCIFF